MEIRAPWSSNLVGVKRHVSHQISKPPFYCQAISLPPPADIADRSRWLGAPGRFPGYTATATASRASKLCPVRSTAQAIRASLLASATTTVFTCARARRPRNHLPSAVSVPESGVIAARAPWISSLRRYTLPRLVIPFRRGLPPVVCCRGTRPSQADRSRPRAKLCRHRWRPPGQLH
jgi:hypothetical protein